MENELTYDPSASIVFNASASAWNEPEPKVIIAQDVSAMARNIKQTSKELTELKVLVDMVKSYLMENHEDLDEHAQEIADILDIELTREVSVTVTVEFQVELALKPNESIDDIIDNMGFSVDSTEEVTDYYQGDVTWTE